MEFCIADTFTDSLSRLTGDEQKSVKTTTFDLQLNPANPVMQFHKLDKARDPTTRRLFVSRSQPVRCSCFRTVFQVILVVRGFVDYSPIPNQA